MSLLRGSLDHYYDTKLPTSTAVENRMQIYSPLNKRPESNNRPLTHKDSKKQTMDADTRTYIKEFYDKDLGMVWIKRIELTQVHKDVLETIFTSYQHNGGFFADAEITYNLSRYDLLKKLGKSDGQENYIWLDHIFEDLKDVEIQLHLSGFATKDSQPKKDAKIKLEFGVLSSFGKAELKGGGDATYQLRFSSQFIDLFCCGISLFYQGLVHSIVSKSNGAVKALIRFCLSNQFVPKQQIEDLFVRLGISDKTHTSAQISQTKALFKPVVNSKTGAIEENEIVKELREKLCIHVTWEGRDCFVAYKKSDLDEQSPHAIIFYSPLKQIERKIKRKELKLKPKVKSSDDDSADFYEALGKKLFNKLKESELNSAQNNRNGTVLADEPDDFD